MIIFDISWHRIWERLTRKKPRKSLTNPDLLHGNSVGIHTSDGVKQSSVTAESPPPESETPNGQHVGFSGIENELFSTVLRERLSRLPLEDKAAFCTVFQQLTPNEIVQKVSEINGCHERNSVPRQHMEKIANFCTIIKQFVDILKPLSDANFAASLVVGGIKVILDLSVKFSEYFAGISDMIEHFTQYITALDHYLRAGKKHEHFKESIVRIYSNVIDFSVEVLHIFINASGEGKKGVTGRQFFKSQWKTFDQNFGRISSSLQEQIKILQFQTGITTLEEQDKIYKKIDHEFDAIQNIERNRRKEASYQEFFSDFNDFNNQKGNVHSGYMPQPFSGSCEWVLNTKAYNKWSEEAGPNYLFITGAIGCGKSVLTAFIADQLLSKQAQRSLTICPIFNDHVRESEGTTNAVEIVRSVIFKIYQVQPSIVRKALDDLSARNIRKLTSLRGLWDFFLTILRQPNVSNICIIIDGFDNFDRKSRRELLLLFHDLHGLSSHPLVKILISSRTSVEFSDNVKEVSAVLHLDELENKDEQKAFNDSLQSVIIHNVHQFVELVNVADHEIYLRDKIVAMANGSFLWAVMALESLKESGCTSLKDFEQILDDIPQEIEDIYRRILAQRQNNKYTLKALHLLISAVRPLKLQEFRVAIAISTDHGNIPDLKESMQCDILRFLNTNLGPLIRIQNERVHLVHPSLGRFLLSSPSSPQATNRGEFNYCNPQIANAALASCCIQYLSLAEFGTRKGFGTCNCQEVNELRALPFGLCGEGDGVDLEEPGCPTLTTPGDFYEYSALYWGRHARKAGKLLDSHSLSAGMNISRANSTYLENWSSFYKHGSSTNAAFPTELDPMRVAAFFGITPMLERIVKQNHGALSTNEMRFIINLTSDLVHIDCLDMLLKACRDEDLVHVKLGEPLWQACAAGNLEIVQSLLKYLSPSDLSHRQNGCSCLEIAVWGGHTKLVSTLLSVENLQANGESPLFYAITAGRTENTRYSELRALIDDGRFDMVERCSRGRTILSCAAEIGDCEAIDLILASRDEAGVKALLNDAGDEEGFSPLSWAARRGHVDVIEKLCHTGRIEAQLQSKTREGANVFSVAARYFHPNVIETLIKYFPAGIDVPDITDEKPLSLLSRNAGTGDAMRALLNTRLVEVNHRDENGHSALAQAVIHNRPELVQILVQEGHASLEQLNVRDLSGRLPIEYVCFGRQKMEETIRVLGGESDLA